MRTWIVTLEMKDGSGYEETFEVKADNVIDAAVEAHKLCIDDTVNMDVVKLEMAYT